MKELVMQKIVVIFIMAVLSLTLTACAAESTASRAPLDKYVRQIAAAVPDSWTVRANGNTIWIQRNKTAEMFYALPSTNGRDPNQKVVVDKPALLLVAAPALTQAGLDALKKSNADRAKALDMLASRMTDLAIPKAGFRDAANSEEQSRLNAYSAVSEAMPYQEIPTLFAPDAAFRWDNPHPWLMPADNAVLEETETLRTRIESLFAEKPLK